MRRWVQFAAVLLLALGLVPMLLPLLALGIASYTGCTLHEGFANPCVIAGADRGDALYAMFSMGWLGLISVPLALLGGAFLLVVGVVVLRRRRR